jgi:Protein of unknown function (DUF1260).
MKKLISFIATGITVAAAVVAGAYIIRQLEEESDEEVKLIEIEPSDKPAKEEKKKVEKTIAKREKHAKPPLETASNEEISEIIEKVLEEETDLMDEIVDEVLEKKTVPFFEDIVEAPIERVITEEIPIVEESVEEIIEEIVDDIPFVEEVDEEPTETFAEVVEPIAEAVEEVVEEIAEAVEPIEEAVEEVIEEIAETVEPIEEAVEEVIEEIVEAVEPIEEDDSADEIAEEIDEPELLKTSETTEKADNADTFTPSVEIYPHLTERKIESIIKQVNTMVDALKGLDILNLQHYVVFEDEQKAYDFVEEMKGVGYNTAFGDSNYEVNLSKQYDLEVIDLEKEILALADMSTEKEGIYKGWAVKSN